MGDAVGDYAGLAGSGARQNKYGPFRGEDCFALAFD